jgi:hypothetical protein
MADPIDTVLKGMAGAYVGKAEERSKIEVDLMTHLKELEQIVRKRYDAVKRLPGYGTTVEKAQRVLNCIAALKDFEHKDWKAGTWLLLQIKRTNFSVDDLKYTFKVPKAPVRHVPQPGESAEEKEEREDKFNEKVKAYNAVCQQLRGDAVESAHLIRFIVSSTKTLVSNTKINTSWLEKDAVKREADAFSSTLDNAAEAFLKELGDAAEQEQRWKDERKRINNEKAALKRAAAKAEAAKAEEAKVEAAKAEEAKAEEAKAEEAKAEEAKAEADARAAREAADADAEA